VSTSVIVVGIALPWLTVALLAVLGAWIGFQLVHQNGRMLSRLEALEARLSELAARPLAAPVAAVPVPAPQPAPAPPAPQGLPLGAPAPAFELPDLEGRRRSLADFRGRDLLVIFFNPRCGFCTRMGADLAALAGSGANGVPLPLVLTTGEAEENRKLVAEHGIRCPVLLQQGMEVASQYQCNGTPMGYRIDSQGRIASEMAVGGPALLALAAETRLPSPDAVGNGHAPEAMGGKRGVEESKLQRNGLPAGTPAPEFTLPLLHGGELSLSEYRGRKVLLVFSDPNCGPCELLLPQLEAVARQNARLQVLMVSRGEVEANQSKAAQHGLTFPILLQKQWEISREYGMFATPVGYLIDEEGIVAKDVAVGVEPILGLLAAPEPPTNGAVKRCACGKPLSECNCGKAKAGAQRRR
jgi:peroxiredoxin